MCMDQEEEIPCVPVLPTSLPATIPALALLWRWWWGGGGRPVDATLPSHSPHPSLPPLLSPLPCLYNSMLEEGDLLPYHFAFHFDFYFYTFLFACCLLAAGRCSYLPHPTCASLPLVWGGWLQLVLLPVCRTHTYSPHHLPTCLPFPPPSLLHSVPYHSLLHFVDYRDLPLAYLCFLPSL